MKNYNIAIDGPAGAGKSTIAKKIAEQLKFIYVDTGAMYRAMGLFVISKEIAATDERSIAAACNEVTISLNYQEGVQQVLLNGDNVTGLIRSEEAGMMASAVAKINEVRKKMVQLQKKIASSSNVIMDGRDIGTVVLPKADLKIYLTAGSKERALRRFKELQEKGIDCNMNDIEQDIINRDNQDMQREISPLKKAEDAVLLDTSNLTVDEVVKEILSLFKAKIGDFDSAY
ncbi:cytidylate kinase [Anaerocolumna cellulosilytica]|uniref:Cytidylate kinase n=1 Tax=Anaerocolumna cellulosilytica TaxID=433286 RepID=A0A6S6R775_9FIRM|nr:(d)CMP kinase [Anaerocolumna cellulosilytica]MBB5197590.1 cytidylate kinase [Anaerocolumna cellulosilytica]BCJ95115.1 cytidylate kinase [Anaerocolumna cellulosilytica]